MYLFTGTYSDKFDVCAEFLNWCDTDIRTNSMFVLNFLVHVTQTYSDKFDVCALFLNWCDTDIRTNSMFVLNFLFDVTQTYSDKFDVCAEFLELTWHSGKELYKNPPVVSPVVHADQHYNRAACSQHFIFTSLPANVKTVLSVKATNRRICINKTSLRPKKKLFVIMVCYALSVCLSVILQFSLRLHFRALSWFKCCKILRWQQLCSFLIPQFAYIFLFISQL